MQAQSPLPELALRPFKVGERDFTYGDRFDRHEDAPSLSDIDVKRLQQQRNIGALTRESYAIAMTRRQPGEIGRGFTKAYLIELGIIDAPKAAPAAKPKKTLAEAVKPAATAPPELGVPIPAHGNFIIPVKQANFIRYEVKDAAGQLLRDKRFINQAGADAFLKALAEGKQGGVQSQSQ